MEAVSAVFGSSIFTDPGGPRGIQGDPDGSRRFQEVQVDSAWKKPGIKIRAAGLAAPGRVYRKKNGRPRTWGPRRGEWFSEAGRLIGPIL
jgi:hypothetical protein